MGGYAVPWKCPLCNYETIRQPPPPPRGLAPLCDKDDCFAMCAWVGDATAGPAPATPRLAREPSETPG
jgi:hypothetical protein